MKEEQRKLLSNLRFQLAVTKNEVERTKLLYKIDELKRLIARETFEELEKQQQNIKRVK